MILKKWKDIPDSIKNEYTETYYKKISKKKFSLLIKRLFDLICAVLLLIILSPILIILAICIKIDSKGPIFYRQERVTQYNKTFRIFKFRTMIQNADKIGNLVTVQNDTRITKVGKIIRKYRLDEFPQLFNVITGDMSFVGTRPEVRKYVDKYTDEMKATLLMPAGITSLASIKFKDEDEIIEKYTNKKETAVVGATLNNKNDLDRKIQLDDTKVRTVDEVYVWEVLPQKMKYNLEYIEKFNVLNDLKICINTVIGVLI